jgi:hypothetical protein
MKPNKHKKHMCPSLCFDCARATEGTAIKKGCHACCWAKCLEDVHGWTARKTFIKLTKSTTLQSYAVDACPLFVSD